MVLLLAIVGKLNCDLHRCSPAHLNLHQSAPLESLIFSGTFSPSWARLSFHGHVYASAPWIWLGVFHSGSLAYPGESLAKLSQKQTIPSPCPHPHCALKTVFGNLTCRKTDPGFALRGLLTRRFIVKFPQNVYTCLREPVNINVSASAGSGWVPHTRRFLHLSLIYPKKKYCHCNSFVCRFVGWHIVRGMFLPAWHKMVLGVVPWKGYLLCSLECYYASNQLQQIRPFSTNHARSFAASTPRWVWTWMILNGKCARICSFFSSNGIMKTALNGQIPSSVPSSVPLVEYAFYKFIHL